MNNSLTALNGVRVGHATHPEDYTGCTVVLFDRALPAAYTSHGGAPGTYQTENLKIGKSFSTRDCLFISGGSSNGLGAASSILQELIKRGRGQQIGETTLPAVSGAIVWDLSMGMGHFDHGYGAEALKNASADPVTNGNVGAGTGTTVGKFQYLENGTKIAAMKAGVGSARVDLGTNGIVCALSVVNALGNVISPDGTILAGNRDEKKRFKTFDDTTDFTTNEPSANTTISIVGMNIDLKTKENYQTVAHIASQGHVRSMHPINTSLDGDTVFVFSTEEEQNILNENGKYFENPEWPDFSVDLVGNAAAKAIQESVYDACEKAETIKLDRAYEGIVPSYKDTDYSNQSD